MSATFSVFNSGEHPVTVEGIAVTSWKPHDGDQELSRIVDPGESALVQASLTTDCSADRPRTQPQAVIDVRTVDGEQRTVEVPVTQWDMLAGARDWICSSGPGFNSLWADLHSPELGEGTLTLDLQLNSERRVTVVGLESSNRAFSVETTELPTQTSRDSGQSIATVWRIVDCAAAQDFEQRGVSIRVTAEDGTTQDVDVSYGAGFGSLVRLAERSCPAS